MISIAAALRNILTAVFLMAFIGNSIAAPIHCAMTSHCDGLAAVCECGGTPNSTSPNMTACTMMCNSQVPAPATAIAAATAAAVLPFDISTLGSSGQLIAPPVPPPRLA